MTPIVTAAVSTESTRLADPVAVRLAVRADAPLRVNLPAELSASPGWRLSGVDAPTVVPLPGGAAEWSAVAHFDPQIPGESVPLAFRPVGVVAGVGAVPESHTFPPVAARVTTALSADRELLRGPAGPEPAADPARGETPGSWLGVAAVLGLTVVVLAALRFRRRRESPPDWVALAAGPLADAALANDLARHLRAWAGTPSETTPEVAARLGEGSRGAELARLLAACDRARFAGRGFRAGERGEVAAAAANLLARPRPRG